MAATLLEVVRFGKEAIRLGVRRGKIHPVYKIEVFDGGKFITFEDWASKH